MIQIQGIITIATIFSGVTSKIYKQYIEYQKIILILFFPEDLIQHQLPPQLHKICI